MSDIRIEWNAEYQRNHRVKYNYNTAKWEHLDWNVITAAQTTSATTDHNKRRDSALTQHGSSTSSGVEATSWAGGHQEKGLYAASQIYGYQGQSYKQASTDQQSAPSTYSTMQDANRHRRHGSTISTQHVAGTASYQTPSNANHSNARRGLPRGEGPKIIGTYNPAVQGSHYEEQDHSYTVRNSDFFHVGRVFAVMWNETAGATSKPVDYNTSRSYNEVKFQGNVVYTNVRRFVVVRKKPEFCFACPIFTYGNQGTKKNGVRPSEHAIAHVWGTIPQLLQDETGIMKSPIPIVMVEGNSLNIASRIYFGIHHPVQYNVKVKDIGYVPQDQVHTLNGNWREEMGG